MGGHQLPHRDRLGAPTASLRGHQRFQDTRLSLYCLRWRTPRRIVFRTESRKPKPVKTSASEGHAGGSLQMPTHPTWCICSLEKGATTVSHQGCSVIQNVAISVALAVSVQLSPWAMLPSFQARIALFLDPKVSGPQEESHTFPVCLFHSEQFGAHSRDFIHICPSDLSV